MLRMNLLIEKIVAYKNSDISQNCSKIQNSKILRTIHNICKINLTPSYFSYAYICFYFLYNV